MNNATGRPPDLSAAGYPEQKDLSLFFRIAETVALRFRNPRAIVQFGLEK